MSIIAHVFITIFVNIFLAVTLNIQCAHSLQSPSIRLYYLLAFFFHIDIFLMIDSAACFVSIYSSGGPDM